MFTTKRELNFLIDESIEVGARVHSSFEDGSFKTIDIDPQNGRPSTGPLSPTNAADYMRELTGNQNPENGHLFNQEDLTSSN